MTRPKNATAFQGQRKYGWKDEHLWSVTTILQSYPKDWMGFYAAKNTMEFVRDSPLSEDWDATLEAWRTADWLAHEATKAHQRHGAACDFEPDPWHWVKGSPWRKRDTAADFGTALHEALGELVAGKKVRLIPGAEAHQKALVEWWDAYRPLVYDSEVQVFNLAEGYAGSLDLIADVYGRRLLIDLKSGSAIGHDVRLQLAAYRFAEFIGEDDKRIADVPDVQGCAVLWIPRDNPAMWQFIEVAAGAAEFVEFLGVKRLHTYVKHNDKTAIGELILPQARVEVA